MDFELALSIYENNVENLQHRYCRGFISVETRDTALNLNRFWLRELVWFNQVEVKFKELTSDELTDEQLQKYNTTPDTFPLYSVIVYRGAEIPCYNDDYGQQVFAIYNGETWSGGSYNLEYAQEFCSRMDEVLEQATLDEIAAAYADNQPRQPMFFSELMAVAEDGGSDGE